MKVKWLGHACFLLTSDSGVKIICDPYKHLGLGLKYDAIGESADIVTKSHGHGDHSAVDEVGGDPVIVDSAGKTQVKGIDIAGTASYHDEAQGAQRGANIIFCYDIDGMRLCHLGDLGHMLSNGQLADIGQVDVLLIPVGGKFTIDTAVASKVYDQIKPKVAIPMHVKTAKCDFVPHTAEDFAKGKSNVRSVDSSEAEFKKEELSKQVEIVTLKHAR
jgi:L-ascorbate metabolism protein UlaG (beta-lactamase superfamily)